MSGRILIIDEDEYNLNDLRIMLQARGYEVEVARDRTEGIEKGNRFRPDLVISEVLPDGLSVIKVPSRITASTGFSAPVIFYAALYRDEQARKHVTSKYQAIHYFVKPYQKEALIKAVTDIFYHPGKLEAMAQEKDRSSSPKWERKEGKSRFQPSTPVLGDADSNVAADSEFISEEAIQPEQTPPASVVAKAASPLNYKLADQALPNPSVSEPLIQESNSASAPPPLSHQESSSRALKPEPTAPTDRSPLERESQKEPFRGSLEWDNLYQKYYAASLPSTSSSFASIFRSRRVQIVALIFLLSLAFFFLRSYILPLQKNKDTAAWKIQQEPTPAQISSLTPSASPPTKEVFTPRIAQQRANENTLSPPLPVLQPSTDPKKDLSHESSKSDPPKKIETPSTKTVLEQDPPKSGSGPSITVVISDITGGGRPPFLLESKRPAVSPQLIQSASAKSLVIRIVINREGKVLEAMPINEDDSNTFLSRAVLTAIRSWKFSAIRESKTETATKYFSFKVVRS